MTYTVKLHVYDLSNGMARMFSQSLIGKQIDGIWHSGIVAYDREWYFGGGGILNDHPHCTPYGKAVQVFDLGSTEITIDLFQEFLDGVRDRFRLDKYHLLENNCNHFTNECSQFLLGRSIPNHIVGLPQEVINTPFGMMIQPLINNFFSQQNWGNAIGLANPTPNNNYISNTIKPTTTTTTTTTTPTLTTATPTLNSLSNHPKFNQQHWHSKLTLPLLMNNKPILFEKGDIDSVFTKLFEFIKQQSSSSTTTTTTTTLDQQVYQENAKLLLSIIKNPSPSTPVPLNLLNYLDQTLLINLPEPNQFPVLEIIRFIMLKNQGNQYFIHNSSNHTISNLLDKMLSNQLSKQSELITLRIIVNSFLNQSSINIIFNQYLQKLVDCTTRGLNSNDKVLKRAVSTVAYNLSLYLNAYKHDEQITTLLASLHHVLESQSTPMEDPEIDFRLLMALGTLLYCSLDNTMDMMLMLEFNPIKEKYQQKQSLPDNIKQLLNEINSLIYK